MTSDGWKDGNNSIVGRWGSQVSRNLLEGICGGVEKKLVLPQKRVL